MQARCPNCGYEAVTEKPIRFTGTFRYGLKSKPGSPREAVKDYEEIATIDTIKQRWKEGDSLRAIARWLNGIGIPSKKRIGLASPIGKAYLAPRRTSLVSHCLAT